MYGNYNLSFFEELIPMNVLERAFQKLIQAMYIFRLNLQIIWTILVINDSKI